MRPEVAEDGDPAAVEEPARSPGRSGPESRGVRPSGSCEDASIQIRSASACQRLDVSSRPDQHRQPRGRTQAGHDARVRIEEGAEDLVAHAGRADQVQRFVEIRGPGARPSRRRRPGPPARPSARRSRRSRGRRSGGSAAPGPRGSSPSGRPRASPIRGRRRSSTSGTSRGTAWWLRADLVQPVEDAPADLGMAQPLEGAADPDRVARPAVGAQAAVEARGDRAALGIGVEGRGQGRSPQADRVRGPREVEVRASARRSGPIPGPWPARPGSGRARSGTRPGRGGASARTCPRSPLQPVNAPLTSRSTRHGPPGRELDPAIKDRLVGPGRLAIDVAPRVEAPGRTRRSSRARACGWRGRGPG